jgi:hypothetical protein
MTFVELSFIFSLFVTLLVPAHAQLNKLENNGGHYRFANLRWRRLVGNTVEFTLETAWRRDYGSTYWQGRGPDGFAITGKFFFFLAVVEAMLNFGLSRTCRT